MSFKEELKSFGFAAKGAWISTSEKHVRFHLVSFATVCLVNWLLEVSISEWAATLACATLVVVSEVLNTVVEKLMDFIHPEQDPTVGKIKDMAAGAVFFAAGGSLIVAGIVYIPKLLELVG